MKYVTVVGTVERGRRLWLPGLAAQLVDRAAVHLLCLRPVRLDRVEPLHAVEGYARGVRAALGLVLATVTLLGHVPQLLPVGKAFIAVVLGAI